VQALTPRRIVQGQALAQVKAERARELRGTMTPAERLLWAALRGHSLNRMHFRRQQVIDGFIVDFYCSAAGLVIEVDGPVHAAQTQQDAERDRILAARGLHILRISNDDVLHHLPNILERISTACSPILTQTYTDQPGFPSEQSS
jgi:very-short-patch-repair endonuclease